MRPFTRSNHANGILRVANGRAFDFCFDRPRSECRFHSIHPPSNEALTLRQNRTEFKSPDRSVINSLYPKFAQPQLIGVTGNILKYIGRKMPRMCVKINISVLNDVIYCTFDTIETLLLHHGEPVISVPMPNRLIVSC
jgi:hypothetical protein